jgi:hypothetical protein
MLGRLLPRPARRFAGALALLGAPFPAASAERLKAEVKIGDPTVVE